MDMRYDLVVIGSGPSGRKGAIAAAKMNKRAAIIERRSVTMGGVCLHTGTIPSKTMREAILHLTGYRQRDVYGDQYRRKRHITMDDLRRKLEQVTQHELDIVRDQLERNGVETFVGKACFVGPNEVEVATHEGRTLLEADKILVATGTTPARPANIPFDGKTVFDSDELLKLDQIPRSLVVIGGGVIGIEYGIMFAILGVDVTVIDGRERLLEFCDREIVDTLLHHARSLGMTFRLGEEVIGIDRLQQGLVAVQLESGKRVIGETALFSVGRTGDTADLNLPAAGLEADERGRLWCNEDQQSWVEHIYGVGDVVGFPALASVSMEQGRRAVCHAFGEPFDACPQLPYGLFTIPEISMVGKNEQQLTAEHVPYEVGMARFREIVRGQINGDEMGMLKLLFHRETRQLLGVHCIGEMATEIVHIGQAVMALGGTIDYFRDNVFNYPTMSECYKVAAFDGMHKISLQSLAVIGEGDESVTNNETAALSV
ncbi:MAG: Si-specific NAD(P)(+) transhydrogenase [Planctomycetaceae bacterium]|nr:Si-specific NAD(P)(+) transhydrogenase [Planctomycetaceae bacterium]MBT6483530.1 Si-specific NAD(P)(+) transhydrogenase [Planctomycetaceae bacterium]MBT6494886.1 Si-specific NAD(P)(+) transhydrogenase [Planctomycetaceae bacterium]